MSVAALIPLVPRHENVRRITLKRTWQTPAGTEKKGHASIGVIRLPREQRESLFESISDFEVACDPETLNLDDFHERMAMFGSIITSPTVRQTERTSLHTLLLS